MLNSSQQEVVDYFATFLVNDEKELIIDAPAGYGKSYLVRYLVTEVFTNYLEGFKQLKAEPKYKQALLTATTNKASDSLSTASGLPSCTIHSLFNLRVTPDYKTGETLLKPTAKTDVIEDSIIFIDECSMIDAELYKYIKELTHNCKIIYVGDKYQLCPVKSGLSPIYTKNITTKELTIPMRNKNHKELIDLCNQLKHTVETGEFHDIFINSGVIDLYNSQDAQNALEEAFVKNTLGETRVVTYTNKRSTEYNSYIKSLRGHSEVFTEGDTMISCGVCSLGKTMVHVEDEVYIKQVLQRHMEVEVVKDMPPITMTKMKIVHKHMEYTVYVPESFNQVKYLLKETAKKKLWEDYFRLKECFLDLRPKEACTIHKAQGSTVDTVIIDISDLSTCTVPSMAARLLYVAVSRAKERVIFYGNIKPKYGNFIL